MAASPSASGTPPPAVMARLAAEHSRPSISAEVVRVEKSSEGKDEHARFVIKVSSKSDGYNSYHVRRRYRQFETLHQLLSKVYRGLPPLPGKASLLSVAGKDETTARAEARREGLTGYLRTLLADPAVGKSDDLASFLELSSSSELFAKLHEKDMQFTFNLAAKDEEIEKMRVNLQQANAERSAARASLLTREEDLGESKGRADVLGERLRASEEAYRQAMSDVASAQRERADAQAVARAAEERAVAAEHGTVALRADLRAAEMRAASAATATATATAQAAQAAQAAEAARASEAARVARAMEESERKASLATADAVEARGQADALVAEAADARARAEEAFAEMERAKLATEAEAEARAAAEEEALRCSALTASATAEMAAATAAAADAEARAAEAKHASTSANASGAASAMGLEAAEERQGFLVRRVDELEGLLTAERAERAAQAAAADAREASMQHELAAAREERRTSMAEVRGLVTQLDAAREREETEASQRESRQTWGQQSDGQQGDGQRADAPLAVPPLPSPALALDSLAVSIPVSERTSGEAHWSYRVTVCCAGVSFAILKRYSDFRTTHARLLANGLAARLMGSFPVLPPKRGWSTQNEEFAERRRVELQAYLCSLVAEPEMRSCSELHSFLELGLILRRGTM